MKNQKNNPKHLSRIGTGRKRFKVMITLFLNLTDFKDSSAQISLGRTGLHLQLFRQSFLVDTHYRKHLRITKPTIPQSISEAYNNMFPDQHLSSPLKKLTQNRLKRFLDHGTLPFVG